MDDLPTEQREFVEKGEASLHSLTNVAYGTSGWHIMELVRKELWRETSRVPDQHGYNVTTYGPA